MPTTAAVPPAPASRCTSGTQVAARPAAAGGRAGRASGARRTARRRRRSARRCGAKARKSARSSRRRATRASGAQHRPQPGGEVARRQLDEDRAWPSPARGPALSRPARRRRRLACSKPQTHERPAGRCARAASSSRQHVHAPPPPWRPDSAQTRSNGDVDARRPRTVSVKPSDGSTRGHRCAAAGRPRATLARAQVLLGVRPEQHRPVLRRRRERGAPRAARAPGGRSSSPADDQAQPGAGERRARRARSARQVSRVAVRATLVQAPAQPVHERQRAGAGAQQLVAQLAEARRGRRPAQASSSGVGRGDVDEVAHERHLAHAPPPRAARPRRPAAGKSRSCTARAFSPSSRGGGGGQPEDHGARRRAPPPAPGPASPRCRAGGRTRRRPASTARAAAARSTSSRPRGWSSDSRSAPSIPRTAARRRSASAPSVLSSTSWSSAPRSQALSDW